MNYRKTLPKTALPRIYFIDQEIASGKFPNAPYLAKKYETSLSSINRDIAYMRDMMDAPIEYDYFKKGFYYTEKTYRLSAAYATEEDILALGMAKNILDLYSGTPIHDAALNLLESIAVPLQDSKDTEWYKNRIIIPKSITVHVDPEIWRCIVIGLQENRIISFTYQDANIKDTVKYEAEQGSKLEVRTVHPYQLLFDRSAWYLSAYDADRKDKRIFSLSRINKATLTDEKFTLKSNFDYQSQEGQSYFGVFAGAKIHKFVIEIKGDARWITERKWAEDQSIQKTANGIKLTFSSNQFDKVMDWLLSQGENARPLAPKQLVDRWVQVIEKMYAISNDISINTFLKKQPSLKAKKK